MLNKQFVMSEELKLQLAERMPGVISAMAEAVTGDPENTRQLFDMMEKGQVESAKYLPMFAKILARRAREGGALTEAMQTTAAQQARMANAWTDAIKIFAKAGFDDAMGNIFKEMAIALEQLTPAIKAFGQATYVASRVLGGFMSIASTAIKGFSDIKEFAGLSSEAVTGLALALGAFVIPAKFRLLAFQLTAVFLILEDLAGYAQGKNSVTGLAIEGFKNLFSQFMSEDIARIAAVTTTFTLLGGALFMLAGGFRAVAAAGGMALKVLSKLKGFLPKSPPKLPTLPKNTPGAASTGLKGLGRTLATKVGIPLMVADGVYQGGKDFFEQYKFLTDPTSDGRATLAKAVHGYQGTPGYNTVLRNNPSLNFGDIHIHSNGQLDFTVDQFINALSQKVSVAAPETAE